MTPSDCTDTCTPKGADDPACGCAGGKWRPRARIAGFGAGFVAICVLCCAVPPALIGLGLISVTTGAYFGMGATAALVLLAVVAVAYMVVRYRTSKPQGKNVHENFRRGGPDRHPDFDDPLL